MHPHELKELATKYCLHIAPPFDAVMKTVGFEGLCYMVEQFGGSFLYVPTQKRMFGGCIAEQIKCDFNGGNYKTLAKKFDVSEKTVRSIVSQ